MGVTSHCPTIEVLYRNSRKVNVFEAANIDGRHAITRRINTFAIWMNAAGRAEAVPDNVLVEGVGTGRFFRGVQVQLLPRNKPQ